MSNNPAPFVGKSRSSAWIRNPETGGLAVMRSAPEVRRFLSFVELPDSVHECWIWIGGREPKGYGIFALLGRQIRAHRYAYECAIGPILPGLVLHHRCSQRACVNPAHLEPMTVEENSRIGGDLSFSPRSSRCRRGHWLDANNARITQFGTKRCRRCERDRYEQALTKLRLKTERARQRFLAAQEQERRYEARNRYGRS